MQTQSDIQARIDRYGLLRSALRAIDSSSPDASAFGLDASFQQVRSCILEVRSAAEGSKAEGAAPAASEQLQLLERVDRMLDELQCTIVELVGAIPLSQLRATLPAIKRQHPEALTALLDVCLIAHPSGSAWSNLVDYLITLLVSEEKDGRRYVARDPTSVTPLMQKLCATFDRDKSEVASMLAQMFREASVEVERGVPSGPIMDRMRAAKHQAMQTLLIPELLQAITAYNVAVSNQRSELIETQRTLEEAEFRAFEESLGTSESDRTADDAPSSVEPPASVEPSAADVLASSSLRAVVAALGRLLRNEDPGPGPESELAAALDSSKLSAYEMAALRDPVASPVASVVASAVGVGLILKNLDELGERLASAGISAEQLQGEWVPELEDRMRAEAAKLMTGDGYEDAKRIAEVRTRQLRKADAEVDVWRMERGDVRAEPTKFARAEPAAPAPAIEVDRKGRASSKSPGRIAVAAAIACVVALVVFVGLQFTGDEDSKAVFLSGDQLGKISVYIESGYRNGHGQGSALVGTLRPQWETLASDEREALGRAIEKKLLAQGISEFMFFDGRRELMLQHAKGRLSVY